MRCCLAAIVFSCLLVPAVAQESPKLSPEQVQAILDKSASFGLKKYPIGFWNYASLSEYGEHFDEAAVEEWADAGFTVPQSPIYDPNNPEQVAQMRMLLDACQARGMKLIVWDPRGMAHFDERDGQLTVPANYAEGVRAATSLLGEHPAVFGFHVGDEPDAKQKEAFFTMCRLQKEAAPRLHPFANLLPYFRGIEARAGAETWPRYLDEFCQKGTPDLLCYDCYAQMNPGQSGWEDYFHNLRLYREASQRNGIPFWNTILSVGHYRYRCPNYDELRWQFNTTVACGAHGVQWFFYYMRTPSANYRLSLVDEHWERTPTYTDIRRVQKNFHRFYGDLFTRLVCTKVMFNPTPLGGGEQFSPDELVAGLEPREAPVLVSEFVDAQRRRYIMLVNLSMTESHKVGLTLRGAQTRFYSWSWQGQEREGMAYSAEDCRPGEAGPTLNHVLAPGQEAVYRVE